ncbi:MAG: phosphotransferase family protein [Acidimicrobiia bacterium]
MADPIDLDDLAKRVENAAQSWAPGSTVESVKFLPGGTVSLVYTAHIKGGRDGIDRVVVKVAPPGLEPRRNRDVLRQARCIDALSRAPGVAVPAILFEDAGAPVEVPPFFATPFLTGECVEPLLVAATAPVAPEIARRRAFNAVDMLADIRKAPIASLGLADEAVTTPADEVRRWVRTLETVHDDARDGYQAAAELLLKSAPDLLGPAVVHGDYRLGNMLIDGTTISGIIDWELWTVSDPRIDLTWMLFFTDEAEHPSARHGRPSNMPSYDELLAAYEERVGAKTQDLTWFNALTYFREGAAMALILKLARRRNAGGPDAFPASVCTELIARAKNTLS